MRRDATGVNRPKALHALTDGMVWGITVALRTWMDDPETGHVLVQQTGAKAFWAGVAPNIAPLPGGELDFAG